MDLSKLGEGKVGRSENEKIGRSDGGDELKTKGYMGTFNMVEMIWFVPDK